MRSFPALLALSLSLASAASGRPPNIVYIMADELAYYELSHMGNRHIKTPRIDAMAKDGIRFTHAFAAAPVCAPLRCNLMTGKHAGHTSVRANDGGTPLRADEITIASLLKKKGYSTGGFGKWGAGGRDSTGVPEKHGFDIFYGYYDQVHAHSFYPPYLIRNSEEIKLAGNAGGRSGKTYSHYAIMEEGLKFIRDNKEKPFFCYLPITPPHGMYDIPRDDPAWEHYRNEAWMKDDQISQDVKNYAAMVTMVDDNVGQVLDLLAELNLSNDTIVFFSGDNGGQDRFRSPNHPRGFFGPNKNPLTGVEFRGGKGSLYEGGLRIPFLVQWPGRIQAGQVSDLMFAQYDILATLSALAGAKVPSDTDGISILPTLLGTGKNSAKQKLHPHFYWEFGNMQAVRIRNWKGIHIRNKKEWELYDLDSDISETTNLATDHPGIIAKMTTVIAESHEPARPGTYTTRERHERDRWAKWGTSRPQQAPGAGKMNRIKEKGLIPFEEMKLLSSSSENQSNNRKATFAIDGRPDTLWHSSWSDGLKTHPHELVIDLGSPCNITGFRYLARQDGGWNGAFADTEFYVSNSPTSFIECAVKASFTKTRKVQSARCKKPAYGRYVKVRVLSEVNGKAWGSAADLGVVGRRSK
ncbi:MAG TPA: N-acetylgalactosamine 6-sulfate sulfatase (GALNS) [Verrucomicrobiales bacterium]|nr:N-acetylgalactosamine 6-sulfate sulfatase (GALNS) [Verrucomicrobiales bacterium]